MEGEHVCARTRRGSSGRGRSAKETRMGRPMKSWLSSALTASCRQHQGKRRCGRPTAQRSTGQDTAGQLSTGQERTGQLTERRSAHGSSAGLSAQHATLQATTGGWTRTRGRAPTSNPPPDGAARKASGGGGGEPSYRQLPGQLCVVHTSASRRSKKRTKAKPRDSRVVWSWDKGGGGVRRPVPDLRDQANCHLQ